MSFRHKQLTPEEILDDFNSSNDREETIKFLHLEEDDITLTKEELISKYETNIVERWQDVPYLRYCDQAMEAMA